MSDEVARVPREDTATTNAVKKDLSHSFSSPTETTSPITAGRLLNTDLSNLLLDEY